MPGLRLMTAFGDCLIAAADENGDIVDGDKVMFITGVLVRNDGRFEARHQPGRRLCQTSVCTRQWLSTNISSVATAVGDRWLLLKDVGQGCQPRW